MHYGTTNALNPSSLKTRTTQLITRTTHIRLHYAALATCLAVLPASCARQEEPQAQTKLVNYACDHAHSITARFTIPPIPTSDTAHADASAPTPNGSVQVSLDNGPAIPMKQTISADGIRYATAGDSVVFWSKGNTALVMRNNAMDLNYTNCTAH